MMNRPDFRLNMTTLALAIAAPALFSVPSYALTLKEATELAVKNAPGIIEAKIDAKLKEADMLIAYKFFDPKIDASYTVNELGGFEYPSEIESLSLASLNSDNPKTNFLPDEKSEGEFKVGAKKIFLNGVYTEVAVELKQTDGDLTRISVSPAIDALNNGGLNRKVDDYFPISAGAVKFVTRLPLWGRGDLAEGIGDYQNKKYKLDAAQATLEHKMAEILTAAVEAYWINRAASQNYELYKDSLARVERWQEQINGVIGSLPNAAEVRTQNAAQLKRIEGFVQEKRQKFKNAETAFNESRVNLAKSTGVSVDKAAQMGDATDAIPTLQLDTAKIDPTAWTELAMANRKDIYAKKLEQKGAEEMLKWFMDFNYPEVNLILAAHQQMVNFGGGGLEGYFDAMGNASGDLGYTAGLQFSMKLGNSAGKGRAIQATLTKMGVELKLNQFTREATLTIKTLASQLGSMMQGMEAARASAASYQQSADAARADKRQTIDAAYRQFETERDWINAEIEHISAQAELAKTIAKIRLQTGTLIQSSGEGDSRGNEVNLQSLITLPTP